MTGDFEPARFTRCDHVIEDLIRNRFMESALISVGPKIKFEGLTFDALLIGDVLQLETGEIGLSGHRTKASELGTIEVDDKIPAWLGIWECFEISTRTGGHGTP